MAEAVSENLLATRLVKDYDLPTTQGMGWGQAFLINPNRPRFSRAFIPFMKRDPRIRLGVALKKGPIIQNVKFRIKASSQEVQDYVADQLETFRLNGMDSALDSFWWGWSCHEIIYEQDFQGRWVYAGLERIDVADAKVVHLDGVLKGMNVYRTYKPTINNKFTYVPIPKCLWTVHQRTENKWFGMPAVFGAFEPWWETWCQKGYRDTRSLWFFKNAFSGPTVYYPSGSTPIAHTSEGVPVMRSNKEIADEIHDRFMTGSGASIPTAVDGMAQWKVERGESQPIPDGLLQYGIDLANEKLEGMGVFPEVVSADGAGSYNGRSVPMQGFMAIEQADASEVTSCFVECCLKPLVRTIFGVNAGFQVLVEGLYESTPYANDIDDPNGDLSIDDGGDEFADPNAEQTEGGGDLYDRPNSSQKNRKAKPGGNNNGSPQRRR